jgi:hypothetical protein
MASIQTEYTILAKDKTGKTHKQAGMTGMFIIEESNLHALTNLYFFLLRDFILKQLSSSDHALDGFKHYTVRFENITIEQD